MKKNYVLDTSVLIEDHNCIEILINGNQNNIFIPETVIFELDYLKDKKTHLKKNIFNVIKKFNEYTDKISILRMQENLDSNFWNQISNDNKILHEIICNKWVENPILVTMDVLLRFQAEKLGILSEVYFKNVPDKEISEKFTGFLDKNEGINNTFFFENGILNFYRKNEVKSIGYDNTPWKIKPLNVYQNAVFELLLNNDIDLVTIQSNAGKGKTLSALAAGLYSVFEKKKFEKLIVVKTNYEIGNELGFLPGNVNQKLFPYFKPIKDLINKICKISGRSLPSKCYDDSNEFGFNSDYIEFMPINYLRGCNIDNSFVLLDEIQNLSRMEIRSVLSRMGENIKCIAVGDINQIDNSYLNKKNNAMNWIVEKFKNELNYAHIVLKGKNNRGPICKLVLDKGL